MNIYLFGSTGMLGGYVKDVLSKVYNVITINRDKYNILNNNDVQLTDMLSELNNDDVIINCAGIIPQTKNNNIKDYIIVNTLFPYKLQEIADKKKCKLIHITTDCVFNGNKGNYNENDIHDEESIYGISKSLGQPNNACIIRTSFIGKQICTDNRLEFLEWIISNKNNTINGFTNHYWNGITCLTLANIIKDIITKKLFWKGCRHIYSPNSLSKYELCKLINNTYKLNININEYETEKKIDKTITSIYETNKLFKINSIENQIIEQSLIDN